MLRDQRDFIKISSQHPQKSTWVGCAALLCWTSGSTLLSELRSIPIFEILFITLGLSCLVISVKITLQKRWHRVKQLHWSLWLLGTIGIYGNDLLLVTATKYAPPAHVHLINYLWPTIVVLFSGFLPREKWLWRYLVAGVVGFYGVYILVNNNNEISLVDSAFCYGYLSALLAAIVWSVYTLIIRHLGCKMPADMIGMYCGIGALISLCNHFYWEVFVWPT